MRAVSTQLESRAREIFTDLGYTVTEDGGTLRAERKWRTVHVTPMTEDEEAPTDGEFYCFVTGAETTVELEQRLQDRNLPYDWAVIGVSDHGEYEVTAATTLPQ
jgi:hypothetical protein